MAKAKLAAAADPDPLVTISYNGHDFQIPRDQEDWPTKAIIAASRSEYAAVVEAVLGPVQWDVLMTVAAPVYKQFMEFLKLFAERVGEECI